MRVIARVREKDRGMVASESKSKSKSKSKAGQGRIRGG